MPELALYLAVAIEGAVIAAGVTNLVLAATIALVATGAIIVAGANALTGLITPNLGSIGAGAGVESYDSKSKGILINKRSNNSPIPVIYGTRLVGGTVVFLASATDPNFLYVNLVASEGTIDSFGTVYFNGKPSTDESFRVPLVWTDGTCSDSRYGDEQNCNLSGNVWTDISECSNPAYNTKETCESAPHISAFDIRRHTGSIFQSADSSISSDLSYYTSVHRLKATAYLSMTFKFEPDAFPTGLPTITSIVKGIRVFDPRSSLTAWSENPALCIRDYLTNTRYGRGIEDISIDDDSFITSANYCDAMIAIGAQVKKRYTCSGVVQTENTSIGILNELLTSCRGFLVFTGGKYKLIIDKPETAVFTFNEDNIVGKWDITLGNKNTMVNRIRANFFNEDKDYQPDIAVIDSPTHRTEDGGILLERMIDLPFTSDIGRAKMIAAMSLNQSRQSIACEFTATIEGTLAEVGDVVYISHETPGWENKKFRIMKTVLLNNDEVRIQAVEYDISAYDTSISLLPTAPDTNLPDLFTVLPPTNIIAIEEQYTTTKSSGLKVRLNVSWTPGSIAFIDHYDLSYTFSGGGGGQLNNIQNTHTSILDVQTGSYNILVRAVNTLGVKSPWASLFNVTAGLTDPPGDVANLSANVAGTTVTLKWDLATDIDVLSGGTVIFKHSTDPIIGESADWDCVSDNTNKTEIDCNADVNAHWVNNQVGCVYDAGLKTEIDCNNDPNLHWANDQVGCIYDGGSKTEATCNANPLAHWVNDDIGCMYDQSFKTETTCEAPASTHAHWAGTVVSEIIDPSWQNSIAISTVASGNSNSIGLPIQVGTYLVKFVDSAGNQSINATSIIVVASVDIIDPQVVITLTQNPTFSGIKTGMIVVTDELQLDNSTTGTYEFDTYGDLGVVQVGRIQVSNVMQAYLLGDTIDDRMALIDSWTDFDNLSVDVSIEVFISITNDDPAGIPVWSPWIKFTPADYQGRAFKFKIEVETGSLQNQISISELVATISII